MSVPINQVSTVSDHLGSWLDTYKWSHIGTLTSRDPMSRDGWVRSFRKWIRRLENVNQKRVNFGFNIEETHSGHVHLHFVLGNISDGVTIERIRSLWDVKNHLLSKVNRFKDDSSLQGLRYTFKDIHDSDHWDVFVRGLERRDS